MLRILPKAAIPNYELILPLLIFYFIQPPFVLESVTEYVSHCMRLHMERSVYNIGIRFNSDDHAMEIPALMCGL